MLTVRVVVLPVIKREIMCQGVRIWSMRSESWPKKAILAWSRDAKREDLHSQSLLITSLQYFPFFHLTFPDTENTTHTLTC